MQVKIITFLVYFTIACAAHDGEAIDHDWGFRYFREDENHYPDFLGKHCDKFDLDNKDQYPSFVDLTDSEDYK
jgi:hypothetical protein